MQRKLPFIILFFFIGFGANSQSYHNSWIDYNKTYFKFKVAGFGTDAVGAPVSSGIVRIPFSTLTASGLGEVNAQDFQLFRDGAEVPIFVSKFSGALTSTDYIEFFGEINNGKLDKEMYRIQDYQLSEKWSLQTDTAAYFLTVRTGASNKRLATEVNNVGGNSLAPTMFFMHTVGRYFRNELSNGFSASVGQSLYSSSYDKGEGFVSRQIRPVGCSGSTSLPQGFSNLFPYLPAGFMSVRVNAVGNAQNSRNVRIDLNGDSLTIFQMDYVNYYKLDEFISINKISSGAASFVIVNKSPTTCDDMRVSMIELNYPRSMNMGGANVFQFPLNASATGRYLAIANFNHGGIAPVLFDISNGKRYVADITNPDTVKVVLQPSTIAYNLVLTTQSGTYFNTISTLTQRNFTNFGSPANQGDYLMISNPLIYGSGSTNYVEQYRAYRTTTQGGSYNPKVIDINDLVDQFAWGIKKHPNSIREFLRYARNTFAIQPKFAFLIGKGVVYNEYRNNESNALIERENLVPTWGYPASDNYLSSEGNVAIPLTPIGRISAVTAQEVGDYFLKVKQYDSAQKSPINTLAGKGWMKNVLQIAGANDIGLGNQLDGYLAGYKSIISDTSFGGKVTNFSKTADPAGYTDAVVSFKNIYERGSSIITYFGHSSATSLDFNLDNPQEYNNRFKYPLFIANGCNAGNHFLFETNRFNNQSTISERFVLAPERGAIGYLSSTHFGVINYLDLYTRQFYKAIGKTKYGKSIGEIVKEGISRALDSTGTNDYYSRVHSEQFALHGDPAIIMNSPLLPDFVMDASEMKVQQSFVSVADSSFTVKMKMYNIGRTEDDSVSFKITRELPNGNVVTLLTKSLAPIKYDDSITIQIPILSNRDKGINKITASLDYTNSIDEISESNNMATIQVIISDDEIRPIFPYNNALVNTTTFTYKASTVNPLSASRSYLMQVDTTEKFNSPLLAQQTVTSVGGVLEFSPSFTYNINTIYYWRVAPVMANPYWNYSSFKYTGSGTGGFEQGHYYQHLRAGLDRIYIDSSSRKFIYKQRTNNLFIVNSIYPTSGLEDSHFSVAVNGTQIIASACDGPVLQFNVFDPITFKPWKNNQVGSIGQYNSVSTTCGTNRQYNFDYLIKDSINRRKAMKFFDTIPNGHFVVVRVVVSPTESINTYAPQWRGDTTFYGSGNSIYHRLKNAGFATLDSFTTPRTFSFVFKKGDNSFAPQYVMSDGVNDRINLNVNCYTPDTLAYVRSIKYGPAKNWTRVVWGGSMLEPNNDKPVLQVIGVMANGTETVLRNLDVTQQDVDITSISAATYPYMYLQLKNQDSITATPYQLGFYRVEFDGVPEGGIAPNLYYTIQDTVGLNFGPSDKMHVGVGFKNATSLNFDSLTFHIKLFDANNNPVVNYVSKTRALPGNDTLRIDRDIDIGILNGWYNLYVEVNPDRAQPEQFIFNNFMYKYVYVNRGPALPVTLLDFNAVSEGNTVFTSWKVTNEQNLQWYEIEHGTNAVLFSTIGKLQANADGASAKSYSFVHQNPVAGKNYYRLKMVDKDGKFNYSQARLVQMGKGIVINIYPNPVSDKLNISVSRPDGAAEKIRILNGYGQLIWQGKVAGTTQVNTASWASGLYLLQVGDGSVNTFKIQK